MDTLGLIPQTGESFTAGGYRFEVIDVDDNRIYKVMITRLAAARPKALRGPLMNDEGCAPPAPIYS